MIGGERVGRWLSAAERVAVAAVSGVARLTGPHLAVLLPVLVVAALVTALTVAASEIYEAVVDEDGIAVVDRPVLDVMIAVRTDPLTWVARTFTALGGPVGMSVLAVAVTVLLAASWHRWTPVVLVAVASAGSLAMTLLGKPLVGRARPPEGDALPPVDPSAAFPSGHALNSVVIAGVVAYLLVRRQDRRWSQVVTASVAVVFVLGMGLSRVYLGHHWFTDVLVAWTVGVAWLLVVVAAHQVHRAVRHRHRATG